MTLVAVWYRKDHKDIYAIADSRLTGGTGILTDQAPKFTTARVMCFTQNNKGHFETKVLDREIAIGYAGSSSVAFATIATLSGIHFYFDSEEGKHANAPAACRVGQENPRQEFPRVWKVVG